MTSEKIDISVVIPLLNEEESLPELTQWIERVMNENNLTYEIVFVDDGSSDNSWKVIKELGSKKSQIRAIKFRRNYGKSPALHSAFDIVRGEVVITMDADLQDSPEEIPGLYNMIKNDGFDLVSGWKRVRHDPLSKTLPTKLFNATARLVSGIKLHDFNCGLKAYKADVVKNIEIYNDMHRYIPILAKNAGFDKIAEKEVKHQARKYGRSKFGISRFFNGYLDLGTLWFLSTFGRKPMHFFGLLGTIVFFIGLIAIIMVGASKLIAIQSGLRAPLVTDSPYFFIALTMIVLGGQLFLAGFLGELISRNSSERNNYKIEEQLD